MAAKAPASNGTPDTSVIHWAPAKRAAPFRPSLPENRAATSSWSAFTIFTPKKPQVLSSGQDDDSRLMLTISVGGSTDSDDTEVTVMPVISVTRPSGVR